MTKNNILQKLNELDDEDYVNHHLAKTLTSKLPYPIFKMQTWMLMFQTQYLHYANYLKYLTKKSPNHLNLTKTQRYHWKFDWTQEEKINYLNHFFDFSKTINRINASKSLSNLRKFYQIRKQQKLFLIHLNKIFQWNLSKATIVKLIDNTHPNFEELTLFVEYDTYSFQINKCYLLQAKNLKQYLKSINYSL